MKTRGVEEKALEVAPKPQMPTQFERRTMGNFPMCLFLISPWMVALETVLKDYGTQSPPRAGISGSPSY